jgi:acetyltransferase-like isoleucine patch superfamily enzyme
MGVTISDNVLLNTASRISHHSTIRSHCFVAPGVTIAGKVTIEECCFLGVGSTIFDNVSIPSGTLIGGGAVVVRSIVQAGTYIGVPAKKVEHNIRRDKH